MSIASLYPSINPSLLLDFANSKVLDPRITFTRTTTATYYDGVTTAKAEENLVLYSQEFDNAAWTKINVTVTANSVAAPDGTTTADTVTQSAGTNYKIVEQTITGSAGQSYAVSVYAKAGTNNYIQLLFGGSNTDFANFDLSGAGAVGTVSGFTSGTTATITSVGNSWFRCVVSWSSLGTAFTSVGVCLIPSSTSARAATTANTNTVYLWGMQMEQRSSVTAYTATTSQAITNYIPVLQTAAAGQARFDHNPTTGESLGLLIEEARTNSFTYSAQFDNAAWTKTNTTITANTIVAPDGTLTGDKVVENTAAGFHFVRQDISVSATAYTMSFFAKAAERSILWATLDGGSNSGWFNLSAGTTGGGSTQITSVGNGWYRCSYTATLSAGTAPCFIFLATSTSSASYTGDGYSGAYIWGAQLEAGSFATSYIPTVASSVTRNADAASMTGTNFSSWFNNGEGTVYFEAQPMYVGTATSSLNSWLWDGTNSNMIAVGQNSGSGQALYVDALMRINGSDAAFGFTTTGVTTASAFKSIAAYEFNNTGAYLNGASFLTDTSCTIPVVNQWKFGGNYALSNTSNGWVRKLSYYPQRLSATNLAALTT